MTALRPVSRRLRVLEGPLAGAAFSLGDRFVIGRSGLADLQLIDTRVSREHALVVVGPDGCHWLIDLSSHNGTFCDGQAVDRARLSVESTFQIEDSVFVVDEALPPTLGRAETQVVSPHGIRVRSGVLGQDTIDLAMLPRVLRDQARARSPAKTVLTVLACDREGVPYEGNLIEDVASFRALQAKRARSELHTAAELDELERLGARLQTAREVLGPDQIGGVFARFTASIPAAVRRPSGERIPVVTEDFGVDGAQVLVNGHDVRCGEFVWLVIDLVTCGRAHSLVLRSRVAWTSTHYVGLSFFDHRHGPTRWTVLDYGPGLGSQEVTESASA